jgi:hypothetical protein
VVHRNGVLVQNLFNALDRHDHAAMASCYHVDAVFADIAFALKGRRQIHAMWHMICEVADLKASFEVVTADDRMSLVRVVDQYTFSDTQRFVRNVIDSHFQFQDGLIVNQRDTCDPRAWAAMAFGGVKGFLAGRIPLLRRRAAARKLDRFVRAHPEYQ